MARLVRFLREGVWATDLKAVQGWRRFGLGALRVTLHVVRSFSHNVLGLTAAGLTLVTVLALVPVLGLVFALGKGLGYAAHLDAWLVELGATLPVDAHAAIDRVRQMVAEVDFGTLGLIGSLAIAWSGLVLFTRVEQALNGIWRTRHRRPWLRRLTDFVALLVLVPPLSIVALLGQSMLRSFVLFESLQDVPAVHTLREAGLSFVPYVMLWIALTAIYRLMPSVRVRWRSAFAGGVVAGTALILLHSVYLHFQVGVAQANAIYATLAALPLLLIYVQLVWTVVLVGGEVSYAVQNLGSLRGGEDLPPPTFGVRQRMIWHLVTAAAAAFRAGEKGVRLGLFASRLDVPRPWVDDAAALLVDRGLLVPAHDDEELLLPGRPPEQIAVGDLFGVLEGGDEVLQRVRLPADDEQLLDRAMTAAKREFAGRAF